MVRGKKLYLSAGLAILIILAASYFIKVPIDLGANYIEFSSLLGILIFYNPFILAIYLLVAVYLLGKGIFFNDHKMKGGRK